MVTQSIRAQSRTWAEEDGLLCIELEESDFDYPWITTLDTTSGESGIIWTSDEYFDQANIGRIEIPIHISRPGTYDLSWQMKVSQGDDITQHNDTWLKIENAQIYAEHKSGHRVAPQPICQYLEGYDCPNGSSVEGYFKVYGQSFSLDWQAYTSDHMGHDLKVDFMRPGDYMIVLSARSSFSFIDKLVLRHTDENDIAYGKIDATTAANNGSRTVVQIVGNEFWVNSRPTYEGRYFQHHKVQGLLFNSRMVQGIFDDLNPETRVSFAYPDTKEWDPSRNTREYVAAMSSWYDHGLRAVTLNLQGGSPLGYGNRDWINSAFKPTGELDQDYMERLDLILAEADRLGMVVILSYFYFGQDQYLLNDKAVAAAVENITRWILDHRYRNLLIEINNECDIHYDHESLKSPRIHELIELVQSMGSDTSRLLVSTSYSGGNLPSSRVVAQSDYILLHGNGVEDPAQIKLMIDRVRAMPEYRGQPIVFNEDDHYDFDQASNHMSSALSSYASWGYFDFRRDGEAYQDGFQSVPVDWSISSERKKSFFMYLKLISGL